MESKDQQLLVTLELDVSEQSVWEMWEVDIVELSVNPWLSQIVLVGKRDGSTNFVWTICWPLIHVTQVLVFLLLRLEKCRGYQLT